MPQPAGRPTSSDGLGLSTGQTTPSYGQTEADGVPRPHGVLQVRGSNVIDSAHYGYVYSMALLPSPYAARDESTDGDESGNVLLVTGSGDETVKVC